MKTYNGKYEHEKCIVYVWEDGKNRRRLDNWRGESSAGFGWGHCGDEAQDLAYSLCVDVTLSRDEGERCYDAVLDEIVARLKPRSSWFANEDRIMRVIRNAYMQPATSRL
jgi:hypothetical protein